MKKNLLKVLLAGLVMGFGGRDHALAWLLSQSPRVGELLITRGNAVTSLLPKARNIPGNNGGNWEAYKVLALAVKEKVDFVVVGPEDQLAAGLIDMLQEVGISAFGPSKVAAQLETSKSWAIELMREAGIHCPRSRIFYNQRKALKFVRRHKRAVVKLNGLARGKGVWVCRTRQAAIDAVRLCMKEHPREILVIQELLKGVEVSVFAFTDGYTVSDSIAASDYKPRFDGDRGSNTGSMGSFSPPMFWNERLAELVRRTILQPIVDAMRKRGILYKGVIYAGLMLTADGIAVLEFNCRFGDSEAQVILPLLESDPIKVMTACVEGRLHEVPVVWNRSRVAATVVMVRKGYPDDVPSSSNSIDGLDLVQEGLIVFHYGTLRIYLQNGTSYVVAGTGGRVLAVTAVADTYEDALLQVYCTLKDISFKEAAWRGDIGELRDLPSWLAPTYVNV
jgi:phosphoribosylamine---glycine ligase